MVSGRAYIVINLNITELQKSRGNRDNCMIILLISSQKHML